MKKILLTISTCLMLISLNNLAFANPQAGEACRGYQNDCPQGFTCLPEGDTSKYSDGQTGVCTNLLDALTQRPNNKNKDSKYVQNLPSITLESGIALAIKSVLKASMLLVIIAIVVAAIYYVISRGKDEDLTKAKDIIVYLIIGLVIIAAAYGIVAGVTQFNVFG